MSHALPNTLVELRRRIVAGEISMAQALDAQQAHLAHDAGRWNAVVNRVAEPHRAPGHEGSLAGVGLAHKDILWVGASAPGCGTGHTLTTDPCRGESPVVRRLEQHGATTLASLAMAEYAGGVTGENPNLPLPINPLFENAFVGGSSSGSAVAVAAGLCYGSLGTDTAGSVRVPAASCGILGLKPTKGLLSAEGCFPLAPSLDTVGILARSARDALQILAASLSEAHRATLLPGVHLTDDMLPPAHWHEKLDNDLALPAAIRARYCLNHTSPRFALADEQNECIAGYISQLGNTLPAPEPVALPRLAEWGRLASIVLHAEAAATHYNALQAGAGINHITRFTALPGAAIPAPWYAQAASAAHLHRQRFLDEALDDADILLTPVFPQGVPDWNDVLTTSPSFSPMRLLGLFSWTAFVNYLGLPAIVFPVGRDSRGRPVCVQAIGRPHSERLLLALAHHHEKQHHGDDGFVASPPALKQSLPSRDQHHAQHSCL